MKRRQAFTLVELMVSMALIIFIMAILSQAFIAALSVFRNLKAQGDLAEKLRGTSQILQHDLAAYHFDGTRRLSDSNFWLNGPPSQGFFRIWQGGFGFLEGADISSGTGSYISTNHYLAFTVRLNGNDMGDFMTAGPSGGGLALGAISTFGPNESRYQLTSGSGTYNSQWAEVAWFLQPQINPTTLTQDMTVPDVGSPGGLPLFTLYRRQRLLVPDNSLVIPAHTVAPSATDPLGIAGFQEMSCWTNGANIYFNSPADITVPWRRFGMAPPGSTLAYPAGLLFGTSSFPPSPWPLVLPPTAPPWGTWTPPSPIPPTYPPSPNPPFLPATPSYPTLAQEPGVPATLFGSDIQLNDVVSFDVRVYAFVPGTITPITNPASPLDPFVTLFTVAPIFSSAANVNTTFYNAATNAGAPAVFDTWSMLDDGIGNNFQLLWKTAGLSGIPMWNGTTGPIIKALQITIRLWDFKTNQTRQVTIVQAM